MKTDRLTLLISPADKAAINARAETLGISVSELVRRAALDYEPDEASLRAEIELLLPEAQRAIANIEATLDRIAARSAEHRREMEWMRSPEGREKIRNDLFENPDIDWDHVSKALADIREGKFQREHA